MKNDLINEIIKVEKDLNEITNKNITVEKKDSLLFQNRKNEYLINNLKNSLKKISTKTWELGINQNKDLALKILNLSVEIDKFSLNEIKKTKENINLMRELINNCKENKIDLTLIPSNIKVPLTISQEVNSDLVELKKCFNNSLYKSTVILCGRILEVCLHRKYYDITGRDILETQPGIGLGKLVAKLSEKNVKFDPGINEQIHLINKIRIQSVHKKEEHFMPSKEQAYATILYTIDITKKLFN